MNHTAFIDFLEKSRACCAERIQFLRSDSRSDEAAFETIRKNVYEIFLNVFNTSFRTQIDEEHAIRFFETKLRTIPENWLQSLEQAKRHGDSTKQYIENLKLEVFQDIKAHFEQARREIHD